MPKKIHIMIYIIPLITVFGTASSVSVKNNYMGAEKCTRQCHSKDSIGNQYKAWQSSPHARAYRVLNEKEALTIAAEHSIPDPASSAECLRCHATARGRVQEIKEEGVGCEACHGPGSGYSSFGNHVDYLDRHGAYLRAIKHGMYPILDIVDGHLKKREKLCRSCHNDKRPCFPKDMANKQKQIITIQVIDELIKGDVDLRHSLRR